MMKKLTIIIIAVLALFLASCSSSSDTSDAYSDDSSSSASSANVPSLPTDVPIYPGSVAVNGYTVGPLTQVTYKTDAAAETVKSWYSTNIPSSWLVDKDWFAFGKNAGQQVYQRHHKTADFNQNPSARAGRQLVLSVGTTNDGKTQILIMHTDYS